MRSDVHVLTLTATPIPRTLADVADAACATCRSSARRRSTGWRSAPMSREFDTVTMREALLREHYRGGQSFFVVPRIADLPEMEAFLRDQVPEVTT